MIFAGLAGLMTRRPMVTAMNAATAAINGFKAKDQAATDQAMKVWETETKNAIELSKFQREAYDTAMAGVRHREDLAIRTGDLQEREATAKVSALAVAMKDPMMAEAIKKGPDEAVKLQKQRAEVEKQQVEANNAMKAGYTAYLAQQELQKTEKFQKALPEERIEMLEAVNKKFQHTSSSRALLPPLSPESIEVRAQRIANYEAPMPSDSIQGRQPGWDEVAMRAKAINPDLDLGMQKNVVKMRSDLVGGKAGQTLSSFTTAEHHLKYLDELVKNLPSNSDVQAQNSIAANLAKRFGYTNVTDFEAARKVVGDEVAKAIVGGTSGSLADREEIAKTFSTANTKKQLKSAIKTYKNLIGGKIEGIESQYSTLPKPLKDKYFPPETLRYFNEDDTTDEDSGAKATTPSAASLAVSPKTETAKPEPAKTEAVPAGATPYSLKNPDGSTKQVYVVGKKIFNMDGTPYTKAP